MWILFGRNGLKVDWLVSIHMFLGSTIHCAISFLTCSLTVTICYGIILVSYPAKVGGFKVLQICLLLSFQKFWMNTQWRAYFWDLLKAPVQQLLISLGWSVRHFPVLLIYLSCILWFAAVFGAFHLYTLTSDGFDRCHTGLGHAGPPLDVDLTDVRPSMERAVLWVCWDLWAATCGIHRW